MHYDGLLESLFIRRRATTGSTVQKPNSSRAAGAGGSSNTMLKLYTDDSPGLRVYVIIIDSRLLFSHLLHLQRPVHRFGPLTIIHRLHLLPTHFCQDHSGFHQVKSLIMFLDWHFDFDESCQATDA
jgi:hypothetical protein